MKKVLYIIALIVLLYAIGQTEKHCETNNKYNTTSSN